MTKRRKIDNPSIVERMRANKEKIMCPTCQRAIIVNKNGECSRCGLLLAGDWDADEQIPF